MVTISATVPRALLDSFHAVSTAAAKFALPLSVISGARVFVTACDQRPLCPSWGTSLFLQQANATTHLKRLKTVRSVNTPDTLTTSSTWLGHSAWMV